MTTKLFPFLDDPISPDIYLSAHVKQISEAKILSGSLSLSEAIQLLLSYVLDSDELHAYSEYELVIEYVNALNKIKDALKESFIKFESNKFGAVDSKNFLESLDEYNLKTIKTLEQWTNFLKNFSVYRIHFRSIYKLKKDIDSKKRDSYSLSSKRDKADQARKKIHKALSLISEEEQKRLLNVEKGKRGLKSEVRQIMNQNGDYKEYFYSDEKTFANRWSEVLDEIRAKLLK